MDEKAHKEIARAGAEAAVLLPYSYAVSKILSAPTPAIAPATTGGGTTNTIDINSIINQVLAQVLSKIGQLGYITLQDVEQLGYTTAKDIIIDYNQVKDFVEGEIRNILPPLVTTATADLRAGLDAANSSISAIKSAWNNASITIPGFSIPSPFGGTLFSWNGYTIRLPQI